MTELNPSVRNVMWPRELTGRLRDGGLYVPTTDQRFPFGSCFRDGRGRSWYYGKAGEVVYPDRVAAFHPALHTGTGSAEAFVTSSPVVGWSASYGGDKKVLLANSAKTFTENQLAGGLIVIHHSAAASVETRMIVGNSASAATPATEDIVIYVDEPFYLAHVTGTTADVMENPYSDIRYGGVTSSDLVSPAGVAPAGMTVANMYGWFQTWGPRYLCAGGGWTAPGKVGERMAVRVGDGSVNGCMTTAAVGFPIVGYIIERNTAGANLPFVDLRIKY